MEDIAGRFLSTGRYDVQELLGSGAMGHVYVALDTRLRRSVVVKVLDESLATNHRVRSRFTNEALIQGNIVHPHIVRVIDVVDEGGLLAIVMDYVPGGDLAAYLCERGGALPMQEALELIAPVLDAVRVAHEHGVVHRDLKPANILVERSPSGVVPKVADFGIAKIFSDPIGAGATRMGAVLGTPAYMAPEQVRGAADVDERADVFALGAIVYELVTGVRPLEKGSEYDIPPPSAHVPGLPATFDEAVLMAMCPSRSGRFESVAALASALAQVASVSPPFHSVPTNGERAEGNHPPPTVFTEPDSVPPSASEGPDRDPADASRDTSAQQADGDASPAVPDSPAAVDRPAAPSGRIRASKWVIAGTAAAVLATATGVIIGISYTGDGASTSGGTGGASAEPAGGLAQPKPAAHTRSAAAGASASPRPVESATGDSHPAAIAARAPGEEGENEKEEASAVGSAAEARTTAVPAEGGPAKSPPIGSKSGALGRASSALPQLVTSPTTGYRLRMVEPGTFSMGSNDNPESCPKAGGDWLDCERPHQATLTRPYYVGVTEVTQADWEKVMGENPSKYKGVKRPVHMVNWYEAARYANALSHRDGLAPAYRIRGSHVEWDERANGFRLLTEAEWEYAARAGSNLRFAGSDHAPNVAVYGRGKRSGPAEVATLKPNALGRWSRTFPPAPSRRARDGGGVRNPRNIGDYFAAVLHAGSGRGRPRAPWGCSGPAS